VDSKGGGGPEDKHADRDGQEIGFTFQKKNVTTKKEYTWMGPEERGTRKDRRGSKVLNSDGTQRREKLQVKPDGRNQQKR